MKDETAKGDPSHTRDIPSAEHITNTYPALNSKSGSGRLEVRCPNCRIPVQIAADTSFTDLTCSVCGSHFSLIDQSNATWLAPPLAKMGRFELLERLGVGGYGTVWKARDQQLDRTVAIKIPRRSGMDAAETELFFKEARAAAQLRHPNIVSVHEVGRDGDSVYIVSDFVRGVTLGEWLTGQQLTNREAAELCAKIADALDHAHEHGVVHRDLKPANIMIDGDLQPHLMDFGLARREVGEITMTLDGQILGTPAYMSPEQALGEAHTADARSDVYSLGVILFQLLTGELPFRGSARMLLHQVIHDPPPSPRKFNGNISKDVETITLKCLEKAPVRRYQTARELVAELRRFLNGEPIHARPVSRAERAWQWCRRYPQVASLSAMLAVALVAGTAVATLLAIRAHRSADQYRQERDRAEENLELAESAVKGFLTQVAGDERLKQEDLHALRTQLLETAAKYYERFAEQKPGDTQRESNRANAYARLATIHSETGQGKKALDEYRKAVTLQTDLVAHDPTRPDYRRDLAESEKVLAWNLHLGRNLPEADKHYAEALSLYLKLAEEFPDEPSYRQGIASTRNAFGMSLRWRDVVAAREQFDLALKEQKQLRTRFPDATEYQAGYAGSSFLIGHLLRTSEPSVARRHLEEAANLQRDLVARYPKVTGYRSALSDTLSSLGLLKERLGDFPGARQQHEEAIALLNQLVRDFPAVVRNRVILVGAHTRYGEFLSRIKDRPGALRQNEESLAIYRGLAADRPDMPEYLLGVASCHFVCGNTLWVSDKVRARDHFVQAMEAAEKAAAAVPDSSDAKDKAGIYRRRVAAVLAELGDAAGARRQFEKTIAERPDDPYRLNGVAWALATSPTDALRDGKRSIELATKACELTNYKNLDYIDTLAAAYAETGDFDSARKWSEKAIAMIDGSVKKADKKNFLRALENYKAKVPTRESLMWPGVVGAANPKAAETKHSDSQPVGEAEKGDGAAGEKQPAN